MLIVALASANERPAKSSPLWRGADSSGAYAVAWNATDNMIMSISVMRRFDCQNMRQRHDLIYQSDIIT